MHILLLNQTFYPDVAATAQYSADLAVNLAKEGHRVTVITGRRSYTKPSVQFPRTEDWRGIHIIRCWSTAFGRGAKWRRISDFLTFLFTCATRLLLLRGVDKVVALTTPPLVSALGAAYARLTGSEFLYWVMDLNPDEAIAAGWLKGDSFLAQFLKALSRFSLKASNQVIVLDRFMKERLIEKGVPVSKLTVIPPWPQDDMVGPDPSGAAAFRRTHGLEGKFVVMYSGNHSPCHPLNSLLEAAHKLRDVPSVTFCFIGGGSEFPRVQEFAKQHQMRNVLCLGYQPFKRLSASLSAADLHVVVMGDPFVGLVHPCKPYNIKRVGVPFLYIGPEQGPPMELGPLASFPHGSHNDLAQFILLASMYGVRSMPRPLSIATPRKVLIEQLIFTIEGRAVLPLPARAELTA